MPFCVHVNLHVTAKTRNRAQVGKIELVMDFETLP